MTGGRHRFAGRTVGAMIDDAKIERLLTRVRREVDDGLLPVAQVAVAHDGKLIVDTTFGAPEDSRFLAFSATKALVAAAIWRLIDQGSVRVDAPAAEYLPSFATNGKDVVTVEQLLTHTGGFPFAPLGPPRWLTRAGRLEAFAKWRLTMEPGDTFMYHPVAGHWVLGEIIAEVTGLDHTDAIEELVTQPLGLPRMLGIPVGHQERIVPSVSVGEPPTLEETEAATGARIDFSSLIPAEVATDALLSLNHPESRAVGVPGGGGVMRAADLALLYQAFLHDPEGMWSPEILFAGTQEVRVDLPDMMGVPSHRTLGLILAGDDGKAELRGFGRTVSGRAFGHKGAGGQLAFADPVSGLSVGYITPGLDQNIIRQERRDLAISSLAGDLLLD